MTRLPEDQHKKKLTWYENLKANLSRKSLGVAMFAGVATHSQAAMTAEQAAGSLLISTDAIFVMLGIILTAIGAIWAVKKMIALGNKS